MARAAASYRGARRNEWKVARREYRQAGNKTPLAWFVANDYLTAIHYRRKKGFKV